MPLTKIQALEYVLKNVFDLDGDDLLRESLKYHGITSIYELIIMQGDDVDKLTYVDEVNGVKKRVPIPWGKGQIINVFLDYLFYKEETGDSIDGKWTEIEKDDFNQFRTNTSYLRARLLAKDGVPVFKPVSNSPAPSTPAQVTGTASSAVMMFQKGIKRDQSHFPTPKSEPLNDSWHRTFEIQAHAQGVAHILDSKYSPSTPDEKEVSQPIQTFMDAVLEPKVQTAKGKEAVQKHEATKDSPAAYTDLVEHHKKSTAADIEARKGNIIIATISDGKFKGTASEFRTNWTKQLKPYGNLTGNGSVFGEVVKVNPIDFQHHYRLVSAAAVQFDDSLTHEDDPWDPGDSFDIDTPVYDLEAKAHVYTLRRQRSQSMGSPDHRRNQRILLPTEIWHAFSDEGKLAWDTLPEADRKMILAKIKPTNNPRIVQLHQQKQGEDMEELQDASADSPVETEQCNDKLQDHKAPQLQPSIWATFLAKDKSAPICQANMCITTRSVIHRVSSTSVKSNQSPVDITANVGIACQDCKVTYVSDRTGDAQGMDNYQLSSISSSTAGVYAVSHKGPVILILHKYALVGRGHFIHSPEQLEWFKHSVWDKSVHVGGLQRIKTADGYTIPIAMIHGLPSIRMRPPTDKELNTLPHIVMTSDTTWDPSALDFDHEEEDDQRFDIIKHKEAHPYSELFDEYGNYRRDITVQLSGTLCCPSSDPKEHLIDQCIVHVNCECELFLFDAQSHSVKETSPLVVPSTPRISSNSTPAYDKLRPMCGWIAVDMTNKTLQHTTQLARTTTGTLLKKVYRSHNPALNVIQHGEPVATDELFSDTPTVECGATPCQVFVGMTMDVANVNPRQTSTPFVNLLEDNVRPWGAPTKLVSDSAPIDISGRAKIVSLTALLGVTVDTSVLLWYHLWQPLGCALTWKILDAVISKVLHQLLLRPTSEGALNI
ncbi:hypothetical protein IV203_037826 [Nitzschia inconspicua]|uniref:Uncharacterized protein n=1 Tax=Nitzschia inconspicua TaxID=303405 RepID=A0A9K3LLG3_9STRA|nr:hypothetical protein IV203_037826 [Nitzschia inconspicua]